MMRLGSVVVAIALGAAWLASSVVAEQNPPRKLVAPVRGEAAIEHTRPDTKVGTDIVTTFRVKNVSSGPIAGLRILETWFKGNEAISGDTYRHPRPLLVNEVVEVKLSVPRSRVVGASNRYDFQHANGTIKPKMVKSLDMPKPAK